MVILFYLLLVWCLTSMSQRNNCFKVHPNSEPGPCIYCGVDDASKRYIHLIQKISDAPNFCAFVQSSFNISETSCICRKCEIKFRRLHTKSLAGVDYSSECTPVKRSHISPNIEENCFLNKYSLCDKEAVHKTAIEISKFQEAFGIAIGHQISEVGDKITVPLCHIHYNKFNHVINDTPFQTCVICEKTSRTKRFVTIPAEKSEFFFKYLVTELNFDSDISINENKICCVTCYNNFNLFCRSDVGESAKFQTTQFLFDCRNNFSFTEDATVNNLDIFTLKQIFEYVIGEFIDERVILLSFLYDKYKKQLLQNADMYTLYLTDSDVISLSHDIKWLYRMLKVKLGKSLVYYAPKKNKKSSRIIYRNGTDILNSFHMFVVGHHEELDKANKENKMLSEKVSLLISENQKKTQKHRVLDEASILLRKSVKFYVAEKLSSSELPDICDFNCTKELKQIPADLWNFLYRLSATDREDTEIKKNFKSWDEHYFEDPFNVYKVLPRLFISSCVFNTQNSHCVQPLHLLLTDVADKFSNSSSVFLSINARLGAGISKDSLKRFITSKCKELDQKQRIISTNSFIVSSFDNLDKNHAYSVVGVGRDKSGFHGTTIQTVVPRPSLKMSNNNTSFSGDVASPSLNTSRDRSISSDVIESLINPENKIGEPSHHRPNKFCDLSVSDFDISTDEQHAWTDFTTTVNKYGFSKSFLQKVDIVVPGIKTFFSLPLQKTEASEVTPVAILDETADRKETVLKVLNKLFEKFQVGIISEFVVIVGDGKSYDHMIKLKAEYGENLNWVLPYPGDWHILKNLLPVFIKIYFDAGLKELANICHKGSTFRILTECTNWKVTHRFLIHVWEALSRHQVNSFLLSISEDYIESTNSKFTDELAKILTVSGLNFQPDGDSMCTSRLSEEICAKKYEIFESFSEDLMTKFEEWRTNECKKSDTFSFWDQFLHLDFLSYIGFYVSIRSRNWHLRNASLKKLSCLFHAFDRHNYLRMIPHHLADILTFPKEIIDFFSQGCFSVSILGEDYYSVALDEAHEMEINLKTKNALNSYSLPSLAKLTFYLPYRAEALHNLKAQIELERESTHHRETSVSYVRTEESTISNYLLKLKSSSLFIADDVKPLHHIFTDTEATTEQTDSLMNYRRYGQEDFDNYLKCYLLKISDTISKPPPRKRRNLKTFSGSKITVYKQKKEIKDQKTVISCLRKKIAFSKFNSKPVEDLEQFLRLPRAISDAEGIPEKGQKSSATSVLRSLYPDAFYTHIPVSNPANATAFIIDGMFIINSSPLPTHSYFSDYAEFLFRRWIVRPHRQFSATEVHLIFDDPNRHGLSPKDIERSRRDKTFAQKSDDYDTITQNTPLPSNWRTFISDRKQKRLLVNYLSEQFLALAITVFSNSECFFVTAGGFDNEYKDTARCITNSLIVEYVSAPGVHEEADTRVWLHTAVSTAKHIIIYSPDTDIYFIGLPLIKSLNKSVTVQLKDTPYENVFLDMHKLVSLLKSDLFFQGIDCIEECIQMLYILSGCDFVSYFRGYGKKSFFDVFRKNVSFITGNKDVGCLFDVNTEGGLLSFYRLISALYFHKYCIAFQPYTTPNALFDSINIDDSLSKHHALISEMREKLWERVLSEVDMMPNQEALRLHWKRCCWVNMYWSQASVSVPELGCLSDFGWNISNNALSFVWDSDLNFQKVEQAVEWYTKGCSCKTGCTSNRCSCRKSKSHHKGGLCGPGCKCTDCKNVQLADDNDVVEDLDQELDDDMASQFEVYESESDDDLYQEIQNDSVISEDIVNYWELMNDWL